ncbi:MAG: molybdopterin-dependent oxidoreductase [Nitrospira sp.]
MKNDFLRDYVVATGTPSNLPYPDWSIIRARSIWAVTYQAGRSTVSGSFTGVPLWTLLSNAGLITDPNVRNDLLGKYLVATGSDGYKAVIALGEIAPRFGNQNTLVAYSFNGQGLGNDGFARLVLPGDAFGGRYVSNLIGLEVFDAFASVSAPEPATGLLLLAALPGLWMLRIQRGELR